MENDLNLEKGFVFLDDRNVPYGVKIIKHGKPPSEEPWLFYWHPNKCFVTLRSLSQEEVHKLSRRRLADDHANMYWEKSYRYMMR